MNVFNVGDLDDVFEVGTTIDEAILRKSGLVNGPSDAIKALGNGEVAGAFHLVVNSISATAREKIEKAGGSVKAPNA